MAQPKNFSVQVQFADFDGDSPTMIWDPPLKRIPAIGERLNIRHEGMTYFLEIEDITNFVDTEAEEHSITIDGKLLNCLPRLRAEANHD